MAAVQCSGVWDSVVPFAIRSDGFHLAELAVDNIVEQVFNHSANQEDCFVFVYICCTTLAIDLRQQM